MGKRLHRKQVFEGTHDTTGSLTSVVPALKRDYQQPAAEFARSLRHMHLRFKDRSHRRARHAHSASPLDSSVVTLTLPSAVLFDMDGTLVDTEPYWMAAESDLVASFGGVWSAEDGLTLVGSGLRESAEILRGRGVNLQAGEIIDLLTARVLDHTIRETPWRPGALELVTAIRAAGIPTALVTMSMRPLAEHVAHGIPGTPFDAIVTGGDVTHAKPHPEPYLRAAELIGVLASDCVAIEDSEPGLASATGSGAVVIGVPAHVPLAESPLYTLWTTLADKSVDDVAQLFTERRATSGVRS